MTCPERHDDLSALLDGALPALEARALEAHLADCASCQAERDALALVVEQVRGLPRRAPPPSFAAGVMARVIEPQPDLLQDVVLLVEEPAPPPVATPAPAPPTPTPAPAPAKRSLTCDLFAEHLSAHVDGELEGELRDRVEAHLTSCVACDAEMWTLDRLRARLRTLPRLTPHDLFVAQVMGKIEVEEAAAAERDRARAAGRVKLWGQAGWVARAAGLLVAAAVALQLGAPEAVRPGRLYEPSARVETRRQASASFDEVVVAEPPPLDYGALDAAVELRSPQGVEAAFNASVPAASNHGQVMGTRLTSSQGELLVLVPARLADDLYLALDGLAEVDGTPAAARAIDAVASEQDRVVLKSGVVLAGQVESETARGVVLLAGGLRQTLAPRRIERVERADRGRRLKIVLRGDAP
jgi:anti-sigma factor RsiW